jgi:microcystin-dependent protein
MNKQNFQQTGGFPLETDTLNNMQLAYSLFNALGEISGNKTIVTGCVETAGVVSDGVVYLNGELYEFRGGAIQTHVRVIEVATSKEFENGSWNEAYYERYVTFSSGPDEIPWNSFIRLISISEIQKKLLPIGVINMWSGALNEIPIGWALCDGTNGTPNLKGRFIVGYDSGDSDYNQIGKSGGAKTVALTEAQMPVHSHYGHVTQGSNTWRGGGDSSGTNATSVPGNTNNKGGGQPHENRPPYYTLAYIMFKGY